jgi:hypothetical protein
MLEALIAVRATPLPEILVVVIAFAVKFPEASRATIVEAPLAEAAVVRALSKVPVVIDEALMAVRAEPLPVNEVPVIAPAANAPPASRRTIVLAPLLEEAVVLAFATVPVVTLDPLIAETFEPSPIKKVPVIAPAANAPLESRETMVEAPLAEAAVVRALAIVPDDILLALIEVMVVPAPIKFAAVTLPPSKAPLASRTTIVEALLDVLAVVRALAIVPLVMLEALIAVRATALPVMFVKLPVVPLKVVALDVVAVMVLAVKSPLESRNTIVLAPLAEAAVVLPLAKVPTEILEALIDTLAALVNWP